MSDEEVARHFRNWARQTIANALSIKAMHLGRPLDDPQRVQAAGREAEATGQDRRNAGGGSAAAG